MSTLRDDDLGIPPPDRPDPVPPHLIRQSRAAWLFAALAGDRVRFDHSRRRWLVWSGHRWSPDVDGSVERLWLGILADRYRAALAIADNDRRTKALEAIQSAGATNAAITAGLEIAASMEPIATTADAWDPDPWLLGCENGVVDLHTGELRDGQPDDMVSRSTGIAYDRGARAPRWSRFLLEVFAGDEALVDWFGRLVGASLVGVMFELLAIHHGLGNNGKSKMTGALRHAFGDYAIGIGIETLVSAKRSAGEATPDLIPLRGARVAFTSEPDQSAKLRGGTLKRLASIDRMTGRPLFGETQTWDPTHSIHLATNHLPAVEDVTEGFWRRIALVPWTVRFRKANENGDAPLEDPDLGAKLDRELAGILAWAVRGAVAYAAGDSLYPFPAAVQAMTAGYRNDSDRLGEFITDEVVYERDATVGTRELHVAYKAWCDKAQMPLLERLGERRFLAEFEEHGGVRRDRDTNQNRPVLVGARLRLSTNPGLPDFPAGNAASSHVTRDSETSGITGSLVRKSGDDGSLVDLGPVEVAPDAVVASGSVADGEELHHLLDDYVATGTTDGFPAWARAMGWRVESRNGVWFAFSEEREAPVAFANHWAGRERRGKA